MRAPAVIFIICLYVISCDKKDDNKPEPPPPPPPLIDTGLKCGDIPPSPSPFGWQDSTTDENKNVNAFVRNPANPDEIIYVVNGDIFGYNKILTVNLPVKHFVSLGILGKFLPSVNKQGWVVFSSVDNDIFKVKSNGDSLKQLTFQKLAHNPIWDYTGTCIYYFQEAYFNAGSQLVKTTSTGGNISGLPMDLPYRAVFKKSDKIIYFRPVNNTVTMVLRDMVNYHETDLISGPYTTNGPFHFNNLTLDNNDENMYWSNTFGIFRCNIASLRIDTLFKSCGNFKYTNPIISTKKDEMTFSWHIIKPLNHYQLIHTYKAMEINLVTQELTEVKIFE